jgi:hypothetical protein
MAADVAVLPVPLFRRVAGMEHRAIPQRLARLYPLQRHKGQPRRLPPVYPLRAAVLSQLPVCKSALLGGNTPVPRVTLQRKIDTLSLLVRI